MSVMPSARRLSVSSMVAHDNSSGAWKTYLVLFRLPSAHFGSVEFCSHDREQVRLIGCLVGHWFSKLFLHLESIFIALSYILHVVRHSTHQIDSQPANRALSNRHTDL